MKARPLLTAALASAALGGTAAPALAHDELRSSSPRKGATVAHLPATIKLNFAEAVPTVIDGRLLLAGSKRNLAPKTAINPRNAHQIRVSTMGDAVGRYTLVVKIVAPDGDKQTVTLRFRVRR